MLKIKNAAGHITCRRQRVAVKIVCASLLRLHPALYLVTPHAAGRMAMMTMPVQRIDVEVMRHAFSWPEATSERVRYNRRVRRVSNRRRARRGRDVAV
jgi:hypothetical protein